MPPGSASEVRLLGPLEVLGDGRVVALTAAKERVLLASLLIEPGSIRSTDFLVEALWGASPPRSSAKLLQVYVSKLRKALPDPIEIHTQEPGYYLELGGAAVDSIVFERLLGEGKEAGRVGNFALSGSLLRRALALWRGPAFGDIAYEDVARAEAERLDELRLVALEARFAAELELGLHADALADLRALASAHPLRERLQGLTMLALYRAGQQVAALDVYSATRALLSDELGLEPGFELRGLQQRILSHDASLVGPDAAGQAPTSLPSPPNPLRGRERELADLLALLGNGEARCVVLTGAGGSGKTRLAIAAARGCASSFANGAFFVDLAPLREPDLLLAAILTSLGAESTQGNLLDALAEYLGPREQLLVLDNMEQLRPAAHVLVELLDRAPRLTLLVTSRVVLHLSGEHVYPVDPLTRDAAAALFLERARASDARFNPDAVEMRAIERICARLDRLPLAIELAASRIRVLTAAEIAERLGQRLPLITDGPRDLPARQQTLRATLEWSSDLLDSAEREALARLAVFAGSWDLATAEAVVGATFASISSLVDSSLLVRTVGSSGSRYAMLETIREFARELLEASGAEDELRRAQADWLIGLADRAGTQAVIDVPRAWNLDLVAPEIDNVRAVLEWAHERDPVRGLRLATWLEAFWVVRDPVEGASWLERLLARAEGAEPVLRARALRALGGVLDISGECTWAAPYYQQSLELFAAAGAEADAAHMRFRIAANMAMRGDAEGAWPLLEECLRESRDLQLRLGESQALGFLVGRAEAQGDLEQAVALALESAAIAGEVGWTWWEGAQLETAADLERRLGRLDTGEAHALRALDLSLELRDRQNMLFATAQLAIIAAERGDAARAGLLWGAIETEEQVGRVGQWEANRTAYEALVLRADGPAFGLGRGEGARLSIAVAARRESGPGVRLYRS